MKTIVVVAMVIVVGIFIGIIATADYGDFVKERELRNLELSFYELQQKIKQCEELSGYSQETCYIELKRFEESHEKMIVRYEGFTGLKFIVWQRMEKILYFKVISFGIPMKNKFRIVVKPGLVMRSNLIHVLHKFMLI